MFLVSQHHLNANSQTPYSFALVLAERALFALRSSTIISFVPLRLIFIGLPITGAFEKSTLILASRKPRTVRLHATTTSSSSCKAHTPCRPSLSPMVDHYFVRYCRFPSHVGLLSSFQPSHALLFLSLEPLRVSSFLCGSYMITLIISVLKNIRLRCGRRRRQKSFKFSRIRLEISIFSNLYNNITFLVHLFTHTIGLLRD